MSPAVGLRQGCSLPPLMFRWCMEDLATEAKEFWQTARRGFDLGVFIIHVLSRADDMHVLATDLHQMEMMMQTMRYLRYLVYRTIGLPLRPDKCKCARVPMGGAPEPVAQHPTPLLGGVQPLGQGLPPGARSRSPSRRQAWRIVPFAPARQATVPSDHLGLCAAGDSNKCERFTSRSSGLSVNRRKSMLDIDGISTVSANACAYDQKHESPSQWSDDMKSLVDSCYVQGLINKSFKLFMHGTSNMMRRSYEDRVARGGHVRGYIGGVGCMLHVRHVACVICGM